MQTFKCNQCGLESDTYVGISQHYRKAHKLKSEDIRIIIYNNGVPPLCKCGCGSSVNWNYRAEKFNDFKHGHYARTTGGFYSPEGAKKSAETRRKRFATGEIQQWNAGISFEEAYGKERADIIKKNISDNEERAKKISEYHSGRPKSEKHREQMKKQLAKNRTKLLTRRGMTKPEKAMRDILKGAIGVESTYQKRVGGYHYDFHIRDTNILIEVDGDFWHCKPGSKYEIPKMKAQVTNMENDKVKDAVAKSNGYTLLRFWETDIQENRLQVVKTLVENLS